MGLERSDPGALGAAGAGSNQFATEVPAYSRNAQNPQPVEGAPIHLLRRCRCSATAAELEEARKDRGPVKASKCQCLPRVVVVNSGTQTQVWLANAPWGFGERTDKVFLHLPLHNSSKGAARYAAELQHRLEAAAWKEHARRDRLKEARKREHGR